MDSSGGRQAKMQSDQCQNSDTALHFLKRVYINFVSKLYYTIKSHPLKQKLFSLSHRKAISVSLTDFNFLASPTDVIIFYVSKCFCFLSKTGNNS